MASTETTPAGRRGGGLLVLFASLAVAGTIAGGASAAEPSWPELRQELYGDQFLASADGVIAIDTPYRTYDDPRTGVGARIAAPEGVTFTRVSVILDENPMPVSAVFDFAAPVADFAFDVTMRINGPTPVHVVAEGADGRLFVAETFLKTSGTGACAAPPGTDPEAALASLGEMDLTLAAADPLAALKPLRGDAAPAEKTLVVDLSHPSHSGMQMDQISLLYIPHRYVETMEIDVDGRDYVSVTGSISLSENPRLSVSVPDETGAVAVKMTDTDGAVSEVRKGLAGL